MLCFETDQACRLKIRAKLLSHRTLDFVQADLEPSPSSSRFYAVISLSHHPTTALKLGTSSY